MLTKRIIPCLDVRNGRVVKGKKFKDIVDVDSPEVLGKYYSDCGADELVFYDITASSEDRKTSLEFVSKVAENISIPFCSIIIVVIVIFIIIIFVVCDFFLIIHIV